MKEITKNPKTLDDYNTHRDTNKQKLAKSKEKKYRPTAETNKLQVQL